MGKPLRLLIVEDSEDDALLTIHTLRKGGYDPVHERVENPAAMREALLEKTWDVILCDYQMPQFNGPAAIAILKETGIDIPLIIVSGAIGEEMAVECMRLGACDYIMKSSLPRLASAIQRELKEAESRRRRKQAEEELKESKALIEAVVENVPLMIFLKEATELRFVIFNRAGEELLGYDRRALIGKNNMDLFPSEQAVHFMADDREVLDGEAGMLDIPEEPILTAGKGLRLLHTRKVCIRGSDGATKFLLGISEDITERKKAEAEKFILEAQFQQAQKLEAVGLLTGGIAHDFNNLLTTIIGNADLAILEVGKDSTSYEFLEDIKGAGERAAVLTRQLLAFSRKQILQPEVANLNEVLGNMDRMLRRVIPENIEIKTILSPDLGQVYVDVGQMEQVLMNLAVNARDIMPDGGKLTFETNNAELDETYARTHISVTPGPYVMLAVTDTGFGMTKEEQARIFEPFFTTKEKGKGTGLGLSTVYGIVKQSKGNLWVYSEPGKGSTFKVYLPRVEETVRIVEEAEKVAEILQGSETILLVEDDGMVRNTTLKILQKYGYSVLCARDGEEAFNLCRQHQEPVQLMLTDVVMPRMSGKELATVLKKHRPEMKVLFMSGYTDNAIVHNGILDKGIAFIQKPFTPADLARKVREVLNK